MAYTKSQLNKLQKDDLVKIANDELHLGINPEETIDTISAAILNSESGTGSTPSTATEPKTPEEKPKESGAEIAKTAAHEPSKEIVKVRATKNKPNDHGGWDRAFYEKHDDHPDGQAWIADGDIHEVAKTANVIKAIYADKSLELVK